MKKTVRSLAITARVIDAATGLVDFCASSPTVDSYGESVDPAGIDFSAVETNLPVPDSHDYSSVRNLLGKVVKCWRSGNAFMVRVQLAIDVPENDLAKLAFGMVKQGYLRACSIGFMPVKILQPRDEGYDNACERLGVEGPSLIYTACRLMEVSLCVIGANPDALVASAAAAGVSRSALQNLRARSSTPTERTSSMKSLSQLFASIPSSLGDKSLRAAEEKLLASRASQSEGERLRAAAGYFRAGEQARTRSARAVIRRALELNPEIRGITSLMARKFMGRPLSHADEQRAENLFTRATGETEADLLGQGLIPVAVADLILDLTALTGVAERSLGIVTMPAGTTKLPRKTANPVALIYQTGDEPDSLVPDTTLTGANLTEKAATFAVLLQISEELIQDIKADVTAAFLLACAQAIAFRLDFCSFSGTGNADTTSGGMTGLFVNNTITAVAASNGNTTLAGLTRADFLSAVSALNPVAIQRGVSFWMHPSFAPSLMTVKDGPSGQYQVRTPLENESGEWTLCGFPLYLTTTAPVATAPGSPVAVCGFGDAYQVGLRQELEIKSSQGLYFDRYLRGIRVTRRGRCDLQDATQFAVLKLAAQ